MYTNAKNRFWRILPITRCDSSRTRDAAQISFDEHDPRGLHCDVGALTHRNADIGLREGRRVVDAIACHRHDSSGSLQLHDQRMLRVGQHLGAEIGDAETARDRLGRRPVIAGCHHDVDARFGERHVRPGLAIIVASGQGMS